MDWPWNTLPSSSTSRAGLNKIPFYLNCNSWQSLCNSALSPHLTHVLQTFPVVSRGRRPRGADQMYNYIGYVKEVLKRASGLGGECTESCVKKQ